jgi:tRNA threonylcarbamoyladenosine biosynthesis protein TsaE
LHLVKSFDSSSANETMLIAKNWIETTPLPQERALVLALEGNLGAGKTAFTKGIVAALHQKQPLTVTSPTFSILHAYPCTPPCYHLDLYRTHSQDLAMLAELEELINQIGIIICIEWAERFQQYLQDKISYRIHLEHTTLCDLGDSEKRRITIWQPSAPFSNEELDGTRSDIAQ